MNLVQGPGAWRRVAVVGSKIVLKNIMLKNRLSRASAKMLFASYYIGMTYIII